MKKGDPLSQHHERMRDLHASFSKKTQYHKQKAFIELKDIYWLVHEFFTAFLERNHSFTEEELAREIQEFKHEFMGIPRQTAEQWKSFLTTLSACQYAGSQFDQQALHALLDQFTRLVDETLGKAVAPPDELTKQLQEAHVFLQNGGVDRAEIIYRSIVEVYDQLPPEVRRDHYEQLEQLYKAIADARSAQATALR